MADSKDEGGADEPSKNNSGSILKRKPGEVAFFGLLTGIAAVGGFGYAFSSTKKRDPEMFVQGLVSAAGQAESGGSLATRALGRGTLYAVGGFSLICFITWKAVGAKDMVEFGQKLKAVTPQAPKKEEPQGRKDFKTLRELADYLINEDEKKKGS